jgi:NTP pyrophosphatase (non-canonical NTP hydrolase)
MNMDELVAFARLQEERFKVLNAGKLSETERLYAQTVKLGEEFGELCEAIMAYNGHQREEKLAAIDPANLSKEFADCVIVLFLLAQKVSVNIPKALEEKIAVLNERFKDVQVTKPQTP